MEPEVDQRLRDLERSIQELSEVPARNIEFLNVEPDKKREGMIVGADGTNWNPGDGLGVYAYYNGAWNRFLDSVADSLLGLNNTWTGTNTHTKRVNHAVHTETAHATTSDPWTGGNLCLYSGSAVTFADIVDAPVVGAVVIAIMNATHTWADGAVFEVDGNTNYTCRVGDVVRIEAKTVSTFRINILSTGDGKSVIAESIPTGIPIGAILDYGGTTLPADFIECDGAAVSRTVTYDQLFTAIGTLWGVGDGSTTFNVPDLKRHTTIGKGGTKLEGPDVNVGDVGGSERHTLTIAQLPAHTSTQQCVSTSVGGFSGIQAPTATSKTSTGTGTSSSTGSGDTHPIMQPTATVFKIIKYQ